MHMIAYVSDYVPSENAVSTDLNNIEVTAKIHNQKVAIKGVLFYQNGSFLQVIEGLENDLRNLMMSIEADPRHTNLEYLIDSQVASLSFSDWNMDVFHLGADKSFDRDDLKLIADRFMEKLLPHSKSFIAYYQGVLDEQERIANS